MEKMKKQYVVYAFGWEIFQRPGQAKLATAEYVGANLPADVEFLHVGIGVYNRLYHFVQDGIHVNPAMPTNYKILKGNWETNYQLTDKKMGEFESWLNDTRHKYTQKTYHISKNNCICFAKEVCDFLGVKFEGEQTKLQGWLRESKLASGILETLRSNPIMQLLSAVSIAKRQTKWVEKIDVGGTIEVEIQNVDDVLHTQFKLTKSGALYEKEDASVTDEYE